MDNHRHNHDRELLVRNGDTSSSSASSLLAAAAAFPSSPSSDAPVNRVRELYKLGLSDIVRSVDKSDLMCLIYTEALVKKLRLDSDYQEVLHVPVSTSEEHIKQIHNIMRTFWVSIATVVPDGVESSEQIISDTPETVSDWVYRLIFSTMFDIQREELKRPVTDTEMQRFHSIWLTGVSLTIHTSEALRREGGRHDVNTLLDIGVIETHNIRRLSIYCSFVLDRQQMKKR